MNVRRSSIRHSICGPG